MFRPPPVSRPPRGGPHHHHHHPQMPPPPPGIPPPPPPPNDDWSEYNTDIVAAHPTSVSVDGPSRPITTSHAAFGPGFGLSNSQHEAVQQGRLTVAPVTACATVPPTLNRRPPPPMVVVSSKRHRKRHVPPGPAGHWYTQQQEKRKNKNARRDGDNNALLPKNQRTKGEEQEHDDEDDDDDNDNDSGGALNPTKEENRSNNKRRKQQQQEKKSTTFYFPAWNAMQCQMGWYSPLIPKNCVSERYRLLRNYVPPDYFLIPDVWHVLEQERRWKVNHMMVVVDHVVSHHWLLWTVKLIDETGASIQAWIDPDFVQEEQKHYFSNTTTTTNTMRTGTATAVNTGEAAPSPPVQKYIQEGYVWHLIDCSVMLRGDEEEDDEEENHQHNQNSKLTSLDYSGPERMLMVGKENIMQVWSPEDMHQIPDDVYCAWVERKSLLEQQQQQQCHDDRHTITLPKDVEKKQQQQDDENCTAKIPQNQAAEEQQHTNHRPPPQLPPPPSQPPQEKPKNEMQAGIGFGDQCSVQQQNVTHPLTQTHTSDTTFQQQQQQSQQFRHWTNGASLTRFDDPRREVHIQPQTAPPWQQARAEYWTTHSQNSGRGLCHTQFLPQEATNNHTNRHGPSQNCEESRLLQRNSIENQDCVLRRIGHPQTNRNRSGQTSSSRIHGGENDHQSKPPIISSQKTPHLSSTGPRYGDEASSNPPGTHGATAVVSVPSQPSSVKTAPPRTSRQINNMFSQFAATPRSSSPMLKKYNTPLVEHSSHKTGTGNSDSGAELHSSNHETPAASDNNQTTTKSLLSSEDSSKQENTSNSPDNILLDGVPSPLLPGPEKKAACQLWGSSLDHTTDLSLDYDDQLSDSARRSGNKTQDPKPTQQGSPEASQRQPWDEAAADDDDDENDSDEQDLIGQPSSLFTGLGLEPKDFAWSDDDL